MYFLDRPENKCGQYLYLLKNILWIPYTHIGEACNRHITGCSLCQSSDRFHNDDEIECVIFLTHSLSLTGSYINSKKKSFAPHQPQRTVGSACLLGMLMIVNIIRGLIECTSTLPVKQLASSDMSFIGIQQEVLTLPLVTGIVDCALVHRILIVQISIGQWIRIRTTLCYKTEQYSTVL